MIHQTYIARKPPKTSPFSHDMDPSAADAAGCLQPAHSIRTHPGVSAALNAFFGPDDFDLRLLTLTFAFGRDFYTMNVITKFHHPTFNRSEVIVLTNKQTDKQTNRQTNRCR